MVDGSPLEDAVRASGFSHCHREVLLESYSYGSMHLETRIGGLAGCALHHLYGLLRLYSASIPDAVRKAVGGAFVEWNAARGIDAG
jgi:hypothetical protein